VTSVLVYRSLWLGDFLTGVPAYRSIARWAGEPVVLAAPRWLRPLADLCDAVGRLLPTEELAVPAWTGPPPDLAVDLHGTGPASHRAVQAVQPRRLVALDCPEAGVRGPRWRAGEHEVARWCRLLDESGIPADPTDVDLPRPAALPGQAGTVIVHPGAKDPARRWPADRFADVARMLAGTGRRVVVTGTATERPLADLVARSAGLPAGSVLAGETDVGQLAALVAHARLVVAGDTGVAHLATAFGTPSVVLFGRTSPAEWGPPPDRPEHQALWAGWAPDPLAALSVREVLTAAVRALAAGSSARSRA
jgi:ADP-heptose:LPS heptosyltransferase